MAGELSSELQPIMADWLLAAADDVFLLGHRNSDWTGLAPYLEEDLAFSSIAQDEIAHAQAYYLLVAELLGDSPERLAYGREPGEYRCAHLVERVDDFNWARAIARQFYYDHFDALRLMRTLQSSWSPLAGLSAKVAQEERFHVQHVDRWIGQLGGGTDESKEKIQTALDALWPDAVALFEPVANEQKLVSAGVLPAVDGADGPTWARKVFAVIQGAGLTPPAKADAIDFLSHAPGGRSGVRSDAFAALFDELAEVYRIEPSAEW